LGPTWKVNALHSSAGFAHLCGGQAIADGIAIDGDLDLALVDHVDDGLSGCVHGDDWHGQSSVGVRNRLLVDVTLHLAKSKIGKNTKGNYYQE
jgi:hypothetical protein